MSNYFRKVKQISCTYLPNLIKAVIVKNLPASYPYFRYAPRFAALNITDNCCFKCIMCDQWKTHIVNELTEQEWKVVFRQLRDIGIKVVSFAGGEAFMRKDLVGLIAYARSLGMESVVTTNGFLLNDNNIKEAITAGVKHFSISVDAVGRDFDAIRGVNGAYEKIMESCGILASYKEKGLISVHLYFTLMKSTLDVYKKVFSVAEKFGFPFVVNLFDYTPYFFSGLKKEKDKFWIADDDLEKLKEFQGFMVEKKRNMPNSIYHLYSEIEYFKIYFNDPLRKDIPCSVSSQRLGIDSRGNVYGGCWSMGSFGNLRASSLKEIISCAKFKSRHRDMFFKQCPGCSCGYTTNLRYSLLGLSREARLRSALLFNKKPYD